MSDPRFARLRTDPRFRKVKRKEDKVVVDERFKGLFAQEKGKSSTFPHVQGTPIIVLTAI